MGWIRDEVVVIRVNFSLELMKSGDHHKLAGAVPIISEVADRLHCTEAVGRVSALTTRSVMPHLDWCHTRLTLRIHQRCEMNVYQISL